MDGRYPGLRLRCLRHLVRLRVCDARLPRLAGRSSRRAYSAWREKQLRYTWLRAIQGKHVDFWQVAGDALDFALETLKLDRPELRDPLMQLYRVFLFPEVPDVLGRLENGRYKTRQCSSQLCGMQV